MNRLGSILTILLLIVGAIWASGHLKWQEQYVRQPSSVEVHNNQLYAAMQLLKQQGRPPLLANNRADIRQLAPKGVLILANDLSMNWDEKEQAMLGEWVRQGGHLIMAYDSEALEHLGAFPHATTMSSPQQHTMSDAEAAKAPGNWLCLKNARHWLNGPLTGLEVEDQTYNADLFARNIPAGVHAWETNRGVEMTDQPVGKGFITLSAYPLFNQLDNQSIGNLDHSILLMRLVNLHYPASPVYLQTQLKDANLSDWLLTHTPAVLLSLAIFIVLWLWHVMPRFGVIHPLPDERRRSLQQQMRATGFYLWQRQAFHYLHAASRRRIEVRLLRKHPDLALMQNSVKWHALAERTGLSATAIERALLHPADSKHALITQMKTLQLLYRLL